MRLEEFQALSDESKEELFSEADEGVEVYSREYDCDGPGGGGCDSVKRYRGLFFVSSEDGLEPGPYRSLREAIRCTGLAQVTEMTTSIVCEGMKVERLIPLLEIVDGSAPRLSINEEAWTYDDKIGWTRAADDSLID